MRFPKLLDDLEHGFRRMRVPTSLETVPIPRIMPELRYFSMPSTVVGAKPSRLR